jgi:MFS family permease
VIGLALVAVFAEAAYAVINALALPVFVDRELRATTYLGWIVGSFLLVESLLKGPMGVVSDHVGRRAVLIVAPLGSALAAVALTWVQAPVTLGNGRLAYLIGVRCLDGIAAAALWTSMYAAVADQVPEERRASAMSILTVSYLGGLAVGPWLGGMAAKHFSVRASFYLVAGLFALTAPRTSPRPARPSGVRARRKGQHARVPGKPARGAAVHGDGRRSLSGSRPAVPDRAAPGPARIRSGRGAVRPAVHHSGGGDRGAHGAGGTAG